jgi:hypothetical protein
MTMLPADSQAVERSNKPPTPLAVNSSAGHITLTIVSMTVASSGLRACSRLGGQFSRSAHSQ